MANLEHLLERTSRTFALSIPVLPEPTRGQVMIAYLLFRIADTFEDAAHWPPARRIEALNEFENLLKEYSRPRAERLSQKWTRTDPSQHAGYRELIADVPFVLESFFALDPEAVASVSAHVIRSAQGMAGFVARARGGVLVLDNLDDLRAYCYVVAGIVGELLTELFLLGHPALGAGAPALRERSRAFGEGLQLVNILKDSASDAAEGRRYLPDGVPRAEVLALARANLRAAAEYVLVLQRSGAERGLLAFTAVPVELAHATLDRVETAGPGAKLTRPEVYTLVQRVHRALDRGEPAISAAGLAAGSH